MITGSPAWHECRNDYCVSRYEAEDGLDLYVCQRHLEQMGFRSVGGYHHTNPIPPKIVDTTKPELIISKRRMAAMENA